jgi:uncharacterized protein
MATSRRTFLTRSAYFLASAGLAGPLGRLAERSAHARTGVLDRIQLVDPTNGGYGPLIPDRILSLPAGFRYHALSPVGTPLSNGGVTPDMHDGMACFAMDDGTLRLVRNHETGARGTFGGNAYDDHLGGTTTVVVDPDTGREIATHASITGLIRPCGGGPTPWGSWLAAEETTGNGATKPHGYVFDVPAEADEPVDPVPLTAMGRFNHEAVAIDPDTGFVYETEDKSQSGIFRYRPDASGELARGGALEMLKLIDAPADTRTRQVVGRPLRATWVPITDPDPDDARFQADGGQTLFLEGRAQGGAIFARGEGAWTGYAGPGTTTIYWASTSGGDIGQGQIWAYTPDADGLDGTLRLLFESYNPQVLAAPDNITVHPQTGVVVLCEDGGFLTRQRLSGVTTDGRLFQFGAQSHSEFAGACFSPDGRWLFVNIQGRATTYAITGPWELGAFGR